MLLLLCLMCLTGAWAQGQRVTIHRKNAEILQVMNDIERQTDYLFVYGQEVNVTTRKTVQADHQKVSAVLASLFADTSIGYEVKGKHIILSKRAAPKPGGAEPGHAGPAKKTLTGRVVDSNGSPVIGATIMEPGTGNGTVSDLDGRFTLSVSEGRQSRSHISASSHRP